MLILIAQTAEPPPAGWTAGADFVVKSTQAAPNIVFPLLAIAGPVLVGCAFIWAAVKYGLPFVREQLAEFRKHTAELLTQRSEDAAGDIAAARALSAAQHESIVQRVEGRLERQTGEIQKISERSERHGEVLRSIAQKIGVTVLLFLLIACPAPLNVQQSLADRVRAAATQCKELPVGPRQDGPVHAGAALPDPGARRRGVATNRAASPSQGRHRCCRGDLGRRALCARRGHMLCLGGQALQGALVRRHAADSVLWIGGCLFMLAELLKFFTTGGM